MLMQETYSMQDVSKCAAQLGLHRVELSNLSEAVSTSSNRGLEADEEAQINVLRAQLQNQMQQPMQEAQRKAVLACLQVHTPFMTLHLLEAVSTSEAVIGLTALSRGSHMLRACLTQRTYSLLTFQKRRYETSAEHAVCARQSSVTRI